MYIIVGLMLPLFVMLVLSIMEYDDYLSNIIDGIFDISKKCITGVLGAIIGVFKFFWKVGFKLLNKNGITKETNIKSVG